MPHAQLTPVRGDRDEHGDRADHLARLHVPAALRNPVATVSAVTAVSRAAAHPPAALSADLFALCIAHPQAVLLPAECMSASGLDVALTDRLQAAGRMTRPHAETLSEAVRRHWAHALHCHAAAVPLARPPRGLNVLVLNEPSMAPPFFAPFAETSLTLVADDLAVDPAYATFLLGLHDQLARHGDLNAALVWALTAWSSTHAAGDAWIGPGHTGSNARSALLAAALARRGHGRAPSSVVSEIVASIARALMAQAGVPQALAQQAGSLANEAQALLQRSNDAGSPRSTTPLSRSAVAAQTDARRARERLAAWLSTGVCHLCVHDGSIRAGASLLWAPGDDPAALVAALAEACASDAAVDSLRADLHVVEARSRAFMAALREPQDLPRQCRDLEASGGVWLDAQRQAIVFSLQQDGFDTRRRAAPPVHRRLLGARVTHEWGHLAHAAGLIHVAEADQPRWLAALHHVGQCFVRLLHALPSTLRPAVNVELNGLAPRREDVPAALSQRIFERLGDCLANRVSARLAAPSELQAYVRANVTPHSREALPLVAMLARQAIEVQYLALAKLPRALAYESAGLRELLIDSGWVQQAALEALFDAVAQAQDCWHFDAARVQGPLAAGG